MHEIRLALSPKQHASLRKGRRVRVSHKQMHEGGKLYTVMEDTFHRLKRAYDHEKRVDIALTPPEIHASGGNLTNKLKQGQKVMNFMGKSYQGIAHAT